MTKRNGNGADTNIKEILAGRIALDSFVQDRVNKLVDDLQAVYPGMELHEILKQRVAPAFLRITQWAETLGGVQIGLGAIFNSGAFCVYWGKDPDSGKVMALLHVRKEKDGRGHPKFGAVGGYTVKPEQSFTGVLRESMEEVCKSDGSPVISPELSKYTLVLEGKDFKKEPPVQYTGYAYELSPAEVRALKKYAVRFSNIDFQKAVADKSDGETLGVKFLPLKDVVAMPPNSFMYRRQYDLYREIARRLEQKQLPASPVGHTIGDSPELFVSRIRHRGRDVNPKISPF